MTTLTIAVASLDEAKALVRCNDETVDGTARSHDMARGKGGEGQPRRLG